MRVPVAPLLAYIAAAHLSNLAQAISAAAGGAIALAAHGGKTLVRQSRSAGDCPFSAAKEATQDTNHEATFVLVSKNQFGAPKLRPTPWATRDKASSDFIFHSSAYEIQDQTS